MGSVTAITNASADVVWKSEYQPFGTTAGIQGTYEFDGGYTGKDVDDVTGLIYMWHRWQDPSTGSFVSEYPAQDGNNWYSYCGGNPVSRNDPTGLFIQSVNSFYKMNIGPWEKIQINNTYGEYNQFRNSGCAVTGMANIISQILINNDRIVNVKKINPIDINNDVNNFTKANTNEVSFKGIAKKYGLNAERYGIDSAKYAINQASDPKDGIFALVQVRITTNVPKGNPLHWVGVNGPIISQNGKSWVPISATSKGDTSDNRTNPIDQSLTFGNFTIINGQLCVDLNSIEGVVLVSEKKIPLPKVPVPSPKPTTTPDPAPTTTPDPAPTT